MPDKGMLNIIMGFSEVVTFFVGPGLLKFQTFTPNCFLALLPPYDSVG